MTNRGGVLFFIKLKRCAVAFLMLALQAQALAHIAQPKDLGSFEKSLASPTLVGDKDALEGNFGLGQSAGENAVKNNYLKFDEIKRLQSEMAQCENQAGGCSTQQRQGIEEKYTLTSRANAQALAECKSVACVESHQKAIAQAGRAGADPLGQYDSTELAQRQRLAEAAVQRQYAIALKIEQSRREMDTLIAGQCQGLSSGACTAKLAQSQEAASQIMDIAAGFTPLGVAVDIRDFVSDPSIAGALMIVAGPVGEAVKVLKGANGGVVAEEAAALDRIGGNANGPVLNGKAPNSVLNQQAVNDLANGKLPGITKDPKTGLPDAVPRTSVPREMPASPNPSATAEDFATRMLGREPTAVELARGEAVLNKGNCPGCWIATNSEGLDVIYRPAGKASADTAATTATVEVNFKSAGNSTINGGKPVKLKFPQVGSQ